MQAWLFLVGELAGAGEEGDEGWEAAGPAQDFRRPRLTAVRGAYIVASWANGEVRSHLALCPEDGGPLQWLVPSETLACLGCGRRYSAQTGQNEDGTAGLVPLPAKVAAGQIWIKLG